MFNVVRTYPEPVSLVARTSYRDEDVIIALRSIFFDKCYLCETKDPTSLNVEHFDAHQGNVNKKYDWRNLFYVCGRCNNIKLARFHNLLDCTDPSVDVFASVKHFPPHTPYQYKLIITPMSLDVKVVQTAELLNEIFNTERTINKKVTGSYLRKNVFKRYNRLLELINIYFDDESSESRKVEALDRLRVLMDKKQEYSAFLRWVVREDDKLNALLGDSID